MSYLFLYLFFAGLFFFFIKRERIRAQKEKEFFAYQVAHEMRSYLTVLLGYAETLKDFQLSDAQKKEIARKIFTSSQRMDQVVQSLLLLTKEEKKKNTADLCKSLEECAEELFLLYPHVALSLPKKSEPLFLSMEEGLLKIVLRNLLENAVRYSKKDPKIKVSFLEKESHVELSIEDEGQGISSKEQKRIFDHFYTSNSQRGHGLGLFIVRKILEKNQAKISVSSEANVGSKFSLLLPKKRS